MPTVVLLGTLDTKAVEYAYMRDVLMENGCDVVTVNAGVMSDPAYPVDFGREDVAAAAGFDIHDLVDTGDRGHAVTTMAEGAAKVLESLWRQGCLDGVLGAGGSGGSSIIGHAMQRLPIGVPKVLVSTMASGDVQAYMGAVDIMITYSVVDIAGINTISSEVLGNAAVGVAAMAKAHAARVHTENDRPVVGATMYGTTTPCVNRARAHLEQRGYEVLVFHATGAGGRSMERLMREGRITAVLDITTSELIDEVAGGLLTAGPERLDTAGELGIPQVISLGGADQITFRGPGTVPDRFAGRTVYAHNSSVTLVRSNADECAALGELIGAKVNRSTGPVTVFIPLRGTSTYAVEGGVFHDPDADAALVASLEASLQPSVELVLMDTDINDPEFGLAMARRLDEHYHTWKHRRDSPRHEDDAESMADPSAAVQDTTQHTIEHAEHAKGA